MDPDLIFAIGVLLAVFSVPSIISALSEGRAPRVSAVMIIGGGSLIVWALRERPDAYSFWEIPDVFIRVIATYVL